MVTFGKISLLLAIFYGAILLFIYLRQDSFIFFPNSSTHSIANRHGGNIVEYQLKQDGEILQGWLVNPHSIKHGLIIYYGGNAEDVFYSLDEFGELNGIATLLVNYRGYGSSSGQASEAHFFKDAIAIHDDIRVRYKPAKIFLMGRSLGSGVATYVASRKNVQGTILVTPYDSLSHMARRTFPWLPTSQLLKHTFNSLEYVQKITTPIMVIYGGQDTVIPNNITENLIEHIQGPKTIHFMEEADHNNISIYPAFWLHLVRFIDQPLR